MEFWGPTWIFLVEFFIGVHVCLVGVGVLSSTKMAHIVWMHWVSRCIRMDTIIESLAGLPTNKISLLHFTNISIYCCEWVNMYGNESLEAEEW
jgi:hypothetical protein